MKTILKKWWWIALIIPMVLSFWFLIWAITPLGPMPEALEALESNNLVDVQTQPWLIFRPVDTNPQTGIILYPGGRVDYRSYAPIAQQIASQGVLVVIPKMPLNLAVFSPNIAGEIIRAYPEIQYWIVGGHSLGGSMAARYAYNSPGTVRGLLLMASYPASSDDLSLSNLEVTSIYGTIDGVATPDQVLGAAPILPGNTDWVAIEGGNHAQFGWYGEQPGDNPASISRTEQQNFLIQGTFELIDRSQNNP